MPHSPGPRTPAATYPLQRTPEEFRRLRLQADAWAPEVAILLDRIGVEPGWRCLDLGCGVGGITDLLSPRVGPGGRVVGVDIDRDTVAAARAWAAEQGLTNVEFVEGEAAHTDLPSESFDLVHIRFLFTTVGWREEMLREALALLRPGGTLAVQEGDAETLRCYPPHEAWDRLKQALLAVFERAGADTFVGRSIYPRLRRAGLENVEFRPCLVGARSHDPFADYLPETIRSVRRLILEQGLMTPSELDEALEACRRHLANPDTITTSVLVMQVWGRKPSFRPAAHPSH